MDPNLPWVIAAYLLTGFVLLGYVVRLHAARKRHLADRQERS